METQVSLYLDTRRSKQHHKYPVKIRVWNAKVRKAMMYPANLDITQTDFEKAWNTKNTSKGFKELKITLNAILGKANKIVAELSPFTFEQFEKKFHRKY